MFMKKIGDHSAKESRVTTLLEEAAWADESNFPSNLKEEIFIKHLDGPLFFGSTSDFSQLSRQIKDTASTVIIRMDKVPYMDQTGLYAMEDTIFNLINEGKSVLFIDIKQQPYYMMERIDIIPDLVPEKLIFDNMNDCITWIKANIKDKF